MVERFEPDQMGVMEPQEFGRWVWAEDYDTLQFKLAAQRLEVINECITHLKDFKKGKNQPWPGFKSAMYLLYNLQKEATP